MNITTSKHHLTILLLIFIGGIGLRWLNLGANSLWFDEAFSWTVSQQPALDIVSEGLIPIMPPLHHLTLHFWSFLGNSEVMIRSLSALYGVFTIPVIYFAGRELLSPGTALAAAFLTAVLPFQIYFSQELRPYSLVILLSSLILWAFARMIKDHTYKDWLMFGLVSGISFYAHYFVLFSLLILQGFILIRFYRENMLWHRSTWSRLLASNLLTLLIVIPLIPLAWTQTTRVVSNFWLPPPSPLQPMITLNYLLFSHTAPTWLIPVTLFLTIAILTLIIVSFRRQRDETRPKLYLLLTLTIGPIVLVLLLSWLIGPVYLDRSFSLITPAYILLLGWGLAHPPYRSPLPLLYLGLALAIIIALGNHYFVPDPAKPPFRDTAQFLQEEWQQQDVLVNLHDSSYLSMSYYAPDLESYLLNNDPDTWIPAFTWAWAGQRIDSLNENILTQSRLWIVVRPTRFNEKQQTFLTQVEDHFVLQDQWIWEATHPIELHLYQPKLVNPNE